MAAVRNDLFSIGEFSRVSKMSVKTLRFYDERGLLKPGHIDSRNGYRYYSSAGEKGLDSPSGGGSILGGKGYTADERRMTWRGR